MFKNLIKSRLSIEYIDVGAVIKSCTYWQQSGLAYSISGTNTQGNRRRDFLKHCESDFKMIAINLVLKMLSKVCEVVI